MDIQTKPTQQEVVVRLNARKGRSGVLTFSCPLHGNDPMPPPGTIQPLASDGYKLSCAKGCSESKLLAFVRPKPEILTGEEVNRRGLKLEWKPLAKSGESRELKDDLYDSTETEKPPDAEINAEIERLATLPLVEYGQQRAEASRELRISLAILDKVVQQARGAKPGNGIFDGKQGKAVLIADPEPLPDHEARQLDGASLLQELSETFSAYLTLPEHANTVLALWVAFTWLHDAFPVSPLLGVTSPERECGKTTLLNLLCSLVRKPFPSANASAASLFRIVDKHSPTILADEVDKWLRRDDERMGLINSGWERRFAAFTRVEGDNNEVRTFSTWAPKALAGILTLPEEIAGRSIEIRMRRQTAQEGARLKNLSADGVERFKPLQRKLYTWTQGILADGTLSMMSADLPEGFNNRLGDNWRVLSKVAAAAGEEWPERVFDAAVAYSVKGREASWGEQLLQDIMGRFKETGLDRLSSTGIVECLASLEERPWPECVNGRPITPRWLARKLSAFGISPKTMRVEGQLVKGYEAEDFKEAFGRYRAKSGEPVLDSEPEEAPF